MDNYKYKLQYIDGDDIITYEFPADIDIYTLSEYLRNFLISCSWNEDVIDSILVREE